MSNKIHLAPVPEYPIFSDRKGDDANDEEDTPYQDELSLYKEDGSLEVYFFWYLLANSNCESNNGCSLEALSIIYIATTCLIVR
jgi:hypothetical protein